MAIKKIGKVVFCNEKHTYKATKLGFFDRILSTILNVKEDTSKIGEDYYFAGWGLIIIQNMV